VNRQAGAADRQDRAAGRVSDPDALGGALADLPVDATAFAEGSTPLQLNVFGTDQR
jgi:hypothetical protein